MLTIVYANSTTEALLYYWCRLPGSNWAPTDYKSVALPNELSRRYWLRRTDSNRRSKGYEPSGLPLPHPAIEVLRPVQACYHVQNHD